jgi:hypothetical protein
MSHADVAEWDIACKDKRCAFEYLGIYKVMPWPKKRKVIKSKWVICIKCGPDGAVQKYKAQVVAHSFTQIKGSITMKHSPQ